MAKLASTIALVLALAVPAAASAGVDLVGNAHGDQVLLHQLLNHHDRPLFAGTRAAGSAFGPLTPISPGNDVHTPAAAVDDSGGAVAVWEAYPTGSTPGVAVQASIRPPNGKFGPAVELGKGVGLSFASNERGDALALWKLSTAPAQYSFRPAGGAFGPPTDAPSGTAGVSLDPDGTATFYAVELGDDEWSLTTATRPPGGEVGAPRRVAAVPSPDPEFVAARNGRVLLAWVGADALTLAERAPGGDFGPLYDVPSHVDSFGIHSVQL